MAWAQLVRIPNVFTVVADVTAAFLLVSHGPEPLLQLVTVVLAGVSLYWAGMILNDVFDVDRDRELRPTRPIPSGLIQLRHAQTAGWALLIIGIGLAGLSGYVPSEIGGTWLPAAVALLLAIAIVAYDGPLKETPLAPAAMGSCRVLSFLLGASPCFVVTADGLVFPTYVVCIAAGFGIYVMGITTMARHEATGGRSPNLAAGLVLMIVGTAALAFAPQMADNRVGWHVSPTQIFPIMIGMIAFPVVVRGAAAIRDPTPTKIQTTIRVGILTIIPLAASFAMLGAGPTWGLAVFMLAIPAVILAIKFRVT
jgi:4-hydroxybenzoate polyprenyltransferase